MTLYLKHPRVADSNTSRSSRSRSRARRLRTAIGWAIDPLERRVLFALPAPAAYWSFDDGAGATAADLSGNGHTGMLGAGASWTAGNVGSYAIRLNGSSSGVVTAAGPVVNTAGSFTASAWVNLAALGGYQTVVSIAGTSVAGFYLGLRGDTGTLSFARLPSDAGGTATVVAAPTAPVAGTWYHLVGVCDASTGTLTLYVDGQHVGSAAYTSGWTASGDTLIGHGLYNGSHVDYVNGSIDDVQLFSTALSAEQVAALAQPAAYPFDEGAGVIASDISGHERTLTLNAGASWAAGRWGPGSLSVNGSAAGNATQASPVLDTSQPFSVSASVKLNSLAGDQTFVSIDGANASGFGLQLRADTGKFAFTRLASDSSSAQSFHADATAVPVTGVWYSLIGVNDVASGQLRLYVNGVLQSSVSYSGGWSASGATVIGGGQVNGARAQFANAQIDEVRFFNSPLSASSAAFVATNGNSIVNVAADLTGITISPELYGLFMEDINYGGDGGVFNDEVRNAGFNDRTNALNAWTAVTASGVTATLTSDATTGPTAALSQSGRLQITSGVTASARAGIANSGYFGVAVVPNTVYQVEFYAKASAGFTGPLSVSLESNAGTVYATATIPAITTSWVKYTTTLITNGSAPTSSTNRFVISTNSPSANGRSLWIGSAHLFPPSYKNSPAHLRVDLMEKLAALKPAIFRVPGGNYLEGNTYADRFDWAKTIGRLEDRPGHMNPWGYWSTDGMGLDEYLQMAELVGAQPILGIYAGYTLDGTTDSPEVLAADVTEAINELHYVLDPVTTTWGGLRAANGHPQPYDVRYVEIGNEDWFSSTYPTRYPLFYNAIRAEFPQLKIIASHTATGGLPYDVIDEHYYNTSAWFKGQQDRYDNVTRGAHKVFVGEYAAREGAPTNNLNGALGDAVFLLGLQDNSDLVTMSAYAPLWANVNGIQWNTNLIGFNNTISYGSPSYYVQVMLSNYHGTNVVPYSVSGATTLKATVSRSGTDYYLAVVNTVGTANTATLNLSGILAVHSTGKAITLAGTSSTATNSIADPTNIVPVTSTFPVTGTSFEYTFPAYSLTILQVSASSDGSPFVVTPATATPNPSFSPAVSLDVLADDNGGESNLTYTWSVLGSPPGSVGFSDNGTNAAKHTVATLGALGEYTLLVTVTDLAGNYTTSPVTFTNRGHVARYLADQTGGSSLSDSSGGNNPASLHGSYSFISGQSGNALKLTGGFASLPGGIVATLNDFTVATWVRMDSLSDWARIFDFGTGLDNYMFLTAQYTGTAPNAAKPRFAIRTPSTAEQIVTSNVAIQTGVWTHIAVTLSGNTATLYVNGVAAGSNDGVTLRPSSLGNTTANFIGRSQFSDPALLGSIDDFRIYGRALSATEIQSAATTALPAAPAGVSAAPGGSGQINLNWSAVPGATQYVIYRAAASAGPYSLVGSTGVTSFQDYGLAADPATGTPYFYTVSAVNPGGEGPQSGQVTATALPPLPDAPVASVKPELSGRLALSWSAAANAASYTVLGSTTPGGPYSVIASGITSNSYTHAGLTNGTAYYYIVRSVNLVGSGPASAEVMAIPTDRLLHLKLDETSGATATDSTGHQTNGTLYNSPAWDPAGKFGGALTLNGSNQYVALPAGIVSGVTDFTIAAWVNLTAVSTWMRIFDFGSGTNTNMFLTPRGGSNVVRFAITTAGGNAEQRINGTAALPTNAWTHVAVTLSGTVGTLYVNGEPVGQNPSMTLNPASLGSTTSNYIGKSQYSDPYLNGRVDDFRIYSRALSAAEVARFIDNVPPQLAGGSFDHEVSRAITLNFSEDVLESLDASDFTIVNQTTNTVVDPSAYQFAAQGGPGIATVVTLTPVSSTAMTADGNYVVSINGVTDFAGNPLAVTSYPFYMLAGDANRDRTVDITDLAALASNWQATGRTFSQGDFNYDGVVDISDLAILATNWQKTLGAPAVTSSSTPAGQLRPGLPRSVGASNVTLSRRPAPFSRAIITRREETLELLDQPA